VVFTLIIIMQLGDLRFKGNKMQDKVRINTEIKNLFNKINEPIEIEELEKAILDITNQFKTLSFHQNFRSIIENKQEFKIFDQLGHTWVTSLAVKKQKHKAADTLVDRYGNVVVNSRLSVLDVIYNYVNDDMSYNDFISLIIDTIGLDYDSTNISALEEIIKNLLKKELKKFKLKDPGDGEIQVLVQY